MKKFIAILSLVLSFSYTLTALAQDGNSDREQLRKEKWEKFRQDRQDFYVKMLELSEQQAAQFIPLFDEMEKLKFEAKRDVRQAARAIEKAQNVTDEQYKDVADRAAALGEKEAQIEKEYYQRFCQILSPRQQFIYHRCEPEFQKMIVKKCNENIRNKQAVCK